jgi:hypothetical protein
MVTRYDNYKARINMLKYFLLYVKITQTPIQTEHARKVWN